MCHRVTPLLFDELEYALHELDSTGHARMPRRDPGTSAADAYPGTQLPLIIPGEQGFEPVQLTWGFETQQEGRPRLVFNTRIETALSQARTGRGLWAGPITRGRCLIPVRAFYESWTQEPPRKGAQLRFLVPGHTVFLLAGVFEDDRFSVVTTSPNASVSPFHNRMPLVLAPGESSVWLGPDFASLADRSRIELAREEALR